MQTLPPQAKIHRNQRIWSMYVDLVEALGTFEEAREVYDRMIDNKVASAQAILNYAEFLQQQKFWEDSFQVYEKGIANFRYPHVERIWKAYLTAFVDRHKGGKIERARDLFIQVCAARPALCGRGRHQGRPGERGPSLPLRGIVCVWTTLWAILAAPRDCVCVDHSTRTRSVGQCGGRWCAGMRGGATREAQAVLPHACGL